MAIANLRRLRNRTKGHVSRNARLRVRYCSYERGTEQERGVWYNREGGQSYEQVQEWAHSFGGVVDAYDRARPTYPREAAEWLVGQEAATVLELGAGTGKLTAQLIELGHDVVATDPDRAMLDRLVHNLPEARTIVASAEDLPLGADAYDVVVAAQAFHWFDETAAGVEFARILRPGGWLLVAAVVALIVLVILWSIIRRVLGLGRRRPAPAGPGPHARGEPRSAVRGVIQGKVHGAGRHHR